MIQLNTTDVIQVTPGTTGGDLDVTATFTDRNGTTETPGSQDTNTINGTTAVTVVSSPSAGVRRLRMLNLRNTSTTITSTYLITKLVTATVTELFKVTLAPGEEFTLTGQGVWFTYNADGSVKASNMPGRYLRTRRFTAGTSFVLSSDANGMYVTVVGGGGGGAGCTSVVSAASAGGGGGSGGKSEKWWAVTPGSTINYTIGAAGTGTSGAAGGNGGDSTITGPDAVVVTAKGGLGAPLATALTTLSAYKGGDGGPAGTNGDLNKGGNPGAPGIVVVVATPVGVSGNGGSNIYGDGGYGLSAVGNGNVGGGNGAGGSGGLTGASVARAGGAGSGGILVIEEYS